MRADSVLDGDQPQFIRHAHAAGLQVHAWTVNDPATMTGLLDLGVDGIMTDQTETLRDVLIARGQWPPRISRLGRHFRQITGRGRGWNTRRPGILSGTSPLVK